jgi:hypothetical protein
VQGFALVFRCRGELLAVEDSDRSLGNHHGDFGFRAIRTPLSRRASASSSRCTRHRRISSTRELLPRLPDLIKAFESITSSVPALQRHTRHDGFGERVKQLRAASHDTVPLRATAREQFAEAFSSRTAYRSKRPGRASSPVIRRTPT